MDIVLTVPKKELKNVEKEEQWARKNKNNPDAICFWKIGRIPKKLNKGDRVYFIHNGYIVNYNEFIGVDYDIHCDVTGRYWDGLCLVMKIPSVPVNPPVPMRGFRGFQYLEKRP